MLTMIIIVALKKKKKSQGAKTKIKMSINFLRLMDFK